MKKITEYSKEEFMLLNAETIDLIENENSEWLENNTGMTSDERSELSKREYKEVLIDILFPEYVKVKDV
jgi:hypothetical protein